MTWEVRVAEQRHLSYKFWKNACHNGICSRVADQHSCVSIALLNSNVFNLKISTVIKVSNDLLADNKQAITELGVSPE